MDWKCIHNFHNTFNLYQQASFLFLCHLSPDTCLSLHFSIISVLPSEKLMSPRRCSSLIDANTSTTMPTVCSPSVSQIALSIAPPSTHSVPPYPDPNPEPEPASSPSGPPPGPGPGPTLPPGPALQFPCTHSRATPAHTHGPGASRHPPTACSLPKSSLGEVKVQEKPRLRFVRSPKSLRVSLWCRGVTENLEKLTQREIKSRHAKKGCNRSQRLLSFLSSQMRRHVRAGKSSESKLCSSLTVCGALSLFQARWLPHCKVKGGKMRASTYEWGSEREGRWDRGREVWC